MSPIDPKKLLAFVGRDPMASTKLPLIPARLPSPSGVLYAKPNPDGSRKMCANCAFWVHTNQCGLHEEDREVTGDSVCGYHVPGTPSPSWISYPGLVPLLPELSGLERVPGGSSCNRCRYFDPDQAQPLELGRCRAVLSESGDALVVEGLACCARYEGQEPR